MKKALTIIAGIVSIIAIVMYSQAFGESLVSKDTSGIYTVQDGEQESVTARTRSFKKFRNGKTRRVAGQVGPIHYRTDSFSDVEAWKDIDLDIVLTPGENWDAVMEANGYQVRFWNSRQIAGKTVRYIAQFRRAGKWLGMAPLALVWENDVGQRELISKPVGGIIPVIDNDTYRVTWIDCFGSGIHYRYNLRPDEFFKTVIIDNKTDLLVPTISGPGLKLTVVLGISWHSNSKAANGFGSSVTPSVLPNDTDASLADEELVDSGRIAYQDESFRDTFWMQRPKAWDSDGKQININWRLLRRANRIFGLISIPATALNNLAVVYPVFVDVDISEEQVGASYDDGWSFNGSYTNGGDRRTTTVMAVNSSNASPVFSLVRFTTVPIPQGSTIDSATVAYWTIGAPEHDPEVTLYCEDIDTSLDLQNPNPLIDNRDLTTASFAWSDTNLGGGFTNPPVTITSLVQEVISRGGWVSGNALSVIGDDTQASVFYYAATFENAPGAAAKLNVSYTEAGGQVITINID